MSIQDRQHQQRIVNALVQGEDRIHLYHTSATFKYQVETLAAMLPIWIDGMAAFAESETIRRDAEVQRMMREAAHFDPQLIQDMIFQFQPKKETPPS